MKYKNKKTIINGIVFDSKKEANRYQQLLLLEKSGKIKDLILQPKFLLQDKFKFNEKTYRKIEYIADFSYVRTHDNLLIIEDVKGLKTDVFKIKEKLFLKIMLEKNIEFEFKVF